MYAGAILFLIGTPLLLNSFWGLLLVPVMATVFLVRVVLEEQMLVSGLEGYSDYRERVRYRLFPGIW
jgi:protein-S-isoprenylcysteine O-methyltransferase Ste14